MIHGVIETVLDAEDTIVALVQPDDFIFLNRKALRAELERVLHGRGKHVLIVRGPSGAGKSYKQGAVQ